MTEDDFSPYDDGERVERLVDELENFISAIPATPAPSPELKGSDYQGMTLVAPAPNGEGKAPTGTEAQVCADIARRQRTGMNKYGMTVADNPLDLHQWLQHAYEECLDQAVYLKRSMSALIAAEGKETQ